MAALLLPFVAAVFAYWPSLDGDWVYDDARFVSTNPAVVEGVAPELYFTDPGTQTSNRSFGGLFRPLRTISFRIVHLISDRPAAQRAASLVLHLLNGLLVLLVLRGLGVRGPVPAALGTGFFLLHPAAVEATAWISARGDVLAMSFGLLSVFLHLRPGKAAATGSSIAFLAALLSKESALFLPLAFVLIDFVRGEARRRWPRYAMQVLVLLLFMLIRWDALGPEAFGQGGGIGLDGTNLTAGLLSSGPYYAAVLLFPWWLSFEMHLAWDAVTAAGGFFLLSGVIACMWFGRRRFPRFCLGLGIVVAALVPVTLLQYLFPLNIMVANRFAYPALLGVAIAGAALSERGRGPAVLLVIVAGCFFVLTLRAAPRWHDSPRLWTAVLGRDPDNPVALFGLGFDELRSGDPARARALLAHAARINPWYPRLAVCLGRACEILAERSPEDTRERMVFLREAQSAFHQAVRLWQAGVKDDLELYRFALFHAGSLALGLGRPDIAREHLGLYASTSGPGVGGESAAIRLIELAEWFEREGDPELGVSLREAARVATGGVR